MHAYAPFEIRFNALWLIKVPAAIIPIIKASMAVYTGFEKYTCM